MSACQVLSTKYSRPYFLDLLLTPMELNFKFDLSKANLVEAFMAFPL